MIMSEEGLSKHICLCRNPMSTFCEDPIYEMFVALSDKNALTVIRGLEKEELQTPFPDGAFGLSEKETLNSLKILKKAGLICSRRSGTDHVYFLNNSHIKDLKRFVDSLIKV